MCIRQKYVKLFKFLFNLCKCVDICDVHCYRCVVKCWQVTSVRKPCDKTLNSGLSKYFTENNNNNNNKSNIIDVKLCSVCNLISNRYRCNLQCFFFVGFIVFQVSVSNAAGHIPRPRPRKRVIASCIYARRTSVSIYEYSTVNGHCAYTAVTSTRWRWCCHTKTRCHSRY